MAHHFVEGHQEPLAQVASGVIALKVLESKITQLDERDREGVAHGELGGGAGGGGQAERAGFPGDPGIDREITVLGESGSETAGEGDNAGPDPFQAGEDDVQFVRFAAV